MANTYTTSDLVTNVQLVGHVPTGNNTFTSAQIITLADRELQTSIVAQIESTRGGYYLAYRDYASRSDGLYSIPYDCIAGTLYNVEMVQGSSIMPISLVAESEQFSTDAPTSTSYGAFLKGNFVQVMPEITGALRIWYSKRPSKLIPVTLAAQVTGINLNVLTVTSVPSNLVIGSLVDVLGDQPPFNLLGGSDIVSIVGTDITLTDVITDVAVGDWIALRDQTCVPQIPVEFRPLLEQRVVVKMYELQGFAEKMKMAQNKLTELEKSTFTLITPRIKTKTKVISAVNGGFLSSIGRRSNFPAGR